MDSMHRIQSLGAAKLYYYMNEAMDSVLIIQTLGAARP
jgi:hypothetical protein